ncbi:MAG: hypothetical protein K9N62_05895 [Verrucomicrobia bacterium]|nr:hypothetical protein [Verrucomicrobiota bacterium]
MTNGSLPHNGNRATEPPVNDVPAKTGKSSSSKSVGYYKVPVDDIPKMEPDRSFIRRAAWNGSGEVVVLEHHSALFAMAFGADRESLLEAERNTLKDVEQWDAERTQLETALEDTRRDITDRSDPVPWRISERIRVGVMFLLVIVFLGVDVNYAAVTLLQSGIEFFDTYWKAAFLNLAIIVGGVVMIDAVHLHLSSFQNRKRFFLIVVSAAFIALAFALPAFAKTSVNMGLDPIARMTGEAPVQNAPNPAVAFILLIVAGNLIAGAISIAAIEEVNRHRMPHNIQNPVWAKLRRDLEANMTTSQPLRERLGLIRGRSTQINAAETVFTTEALELYRIAAAERSAFKSL